MMKPITIEFFHDVICSFCFPMSNRMRKLVKEFPALIIQHKSFALGWREEDFVAQFGSRQAVKAEVVHHWEMANYNDDERRFNIKGMKNTDFNFPLSKNGLIAAKAAFILKGEEGYWDAFDAIQQALFVESKNIEEEKVLAEAIAKAGLDVEKWEELYKDPKTEALVLEDLKLAASYGIQSAPSLVINGQGLISGAVDWETLIGALEMITSEEGSSLKALQNPEVGESCRLEDGQDKCD